VRTDLPYRSCDANDTADEKECSGKSVFLFPCSILGVPWLCVRMYLCFILMSFMMRRYCEYANPMECVPWIFGSFRDLSKLFVNDVCVRDFGIRVFFIATSFSDQSEKLTSQKILTE